jgi:AcrR family transcriptional regulator
MAGGMRQGSSSVKSVAARSVAAGRRRQSPAPERRRGDLLDAATALFAANGVEATSIAAITAAAGVSKGNFYRYFASREELIAALKARFVDEVLAAVGDFGERVGRDDWWELVDDFVAAMVGTLLDRRDLIRIFVAQPSSDASAYFFLDAEERIDGFIAAGIELGVAEGAFHVEDPVMTATLLQHALSATVEHAIIHGVDVDRERLVGAAQRLARAALRGS